MKSILLIACILAYAVAQQPTLVHLTNGTQVSGSLAVAVDSETGAQAVDHYAFPIPANAQVITVDFNADPSGNSDCYYLYLFYSVSTIPCSSLWSAESDNFLPCQASVYDSTTSTTQLVLRAGDSQVSTFEPGSTLYLSVGKQSSYYDNVCPYTITVGNTNCSTSQVGLYEDSTESSCVAVTDHSFPAAWSATIEEDTPLVYRFPVSELTGNIHISINSTYYVYAYGGYSYPYNYYSDYSAPCSESSDYEGTNEYSLELTCKQPKNGWFYLTLYTTTSSSVEATVSVSSTPCAADAGGVMCQQFALNYTDSTPVNRTIRAYNSSIDTSPYYPSDFYYVNYPAGTLANVNFTVCNGAQDLYVTYSKDQFPNYNSNYQSLSPFECLTVVLRPEDTYIGGTYVVGVLNPSSTTVASYQISKASATFDSTTGQTTEGSGAAALVAPVVMVLAMLALLF